MVDGYCVKCKTKRPMKDPQAKKMENGRDFILGICSVCNGKISRIGKL